MNEKKRNNTIREITSKEQFEKLIQDRPEYTETWHVNKLIAEEILLGTKTENMREMTPFEISELAQYLDVEEENLQGPFFVDKTLFCPKCKRSMTFYDFVKTAIETETGRHSKGLIAEILSGRNGHWVTIRGKKHEREVICTNCNKGIKYKNHTYTSRNYAYA
ncbi:hypothetical protein [Bacillus halotolerans]|uniref:hypothetical protein n=1 Tax=Bacillus halotolerans TaxID=260554 RepID=UPI0003D7A323|nr:hypothetical protein [Bacillus halotolerans]